MAADPNRFTPYLESLTATLTRTFGIAIIGAFVAIIIRFHHLPASSAQWYGWLTLFVSIAWISFGGHWVELVYLNGIRPKISTWSDAALLFVRLGVWIIGGTILFLCAIASRSFLTAHESPTHSQFIFALKFGGLIFFAVELIPHTFFLLRGRPSFFNLRG